jgi:hypothetical protein
VAVNDGKNKFGQKIKPWGALIKSSLFLAAMVGVGIYLYANSMIFPAPPKPVEMYTQNELKRMLNNTVDYDKTGLWLEHDI